MISATPRIFYLDTNAIISLVEGSEDLTAAQKDFIAKADADAIQAATSELTLAECLVKPVSDQDASATQAYIKFVRDRPGLMVLPVSREVLFEAACQRAALKMALADSIHVATAMVAGCSFFVTNDKRLKAPAGIVLLSWSALSSGDFNL